ncbi:MAG: hypothetical protein IJ587_12970 [Synergistaceae bacterium]|nr:hypothetical protein [Synergistaceae bacterium]
MNTKNTGIAEIAEMTGEKPEIKLEVKPDSASNANTAKSVRCDTYSYAFTPEILTQCEGDIDYTFFRCAYCGKAYMVSITDEKLQQDIAKYVDIMKKGKLSAEEMREAIELLRANKERAKLLKHQYFKEESHE